MKKTKKHTFGKDIYLLGQDDQGTLYWLEAPSWDCGHYWGFGYIETYTNNKQPQNAKDIKSHQHATKFMSEYFTEWNGSKPILKNKTFSDKEGWELSELFEQFYFLSKASENFRIGKCHVADTKVKSWEKPELSKEIDNKLIPEVTSRILEILSPGEK